MRYPRPLALIFVLAVTAIVAAGCGGSNSGSDDSTGASSDNSRNAAQVKFRQCMRENGVDIPDNPGQGGGPGANQNSIDRTALQKAQKACAKYQRQAFGDVSADQQQQFRDSLTKFTACMRQHGVEISDPTSGSGGGPPAGGNQPDQNDPKVKAATKACQSKLPQGAQGGPGGPGGGDQ